MQFHKNKEIVLIVDFGSQLTKLIARRIRDLGVYSEIVTPKELQKIKNFNTIKGIVLSGGPSTVTKKKFQRNEFKQVFKYLGNQNIKVLSFEEYLNKNDIDKKNLYWDNDLHFNIEGHKIYAQYLYQNINK